MSDELERAARSANLKEFDAADLYSVERVMGDAGEVEILRPITVGGLRDTVRSVRFFSSITVMFRGMPQVVRFEIRGAGSLAQALGMWKEAALTEAGVYTNRMEEQYRRAMIAGPEHARVRPALSS